MKLNLKDGVKEVRGDAGSGSLGAFQGINLPA